MQKTVFGIKKDAFRFSMLFLAPAFVVYVGIVITPIVLTFAYSLTDWDGIGPKVFTWFSNYKDILFDADYWKIARNSFTLVLLSFVFQNPAALILAFMVSRVGRGYRIFRSVNFLPVVVSAAATALMFSLMFNSQVGPVNAILDAVGLGAWKHNWLSDPGTVLYVVALTQLWQYMGVQFILFLAAIQSIPEELLEAAYLEGASSTRVLFRIILPLIWEVVQVALIWSFTGSLKAFDHSWLMTWGGPGIASTYLPVYVFRTAFKEFNFSYGSTIATTIVFYSLTFTVLFKKFFSRESVQY